LVAGVSFVMPLILSDDFESAVIDLRRRVSDFRDSQIAHEKSPRTMRGTMWGVTGELMLVNNRIYPKGSDKQAESESLSSLATALEAYLDHVITFIEVNRSMARFKPAVTS
jgi:hypothetical protein